MASAISDEQSRSAANAQPYTIYHKLTAEFIGVLIFVFFGVSQALAHNSLLVAALTHGLILFVLISSLTVTLTIYLCGKMRLLEAACYIVIQLIAGFVGVMLCRAIMNSEQWSGIMAGATVLQSGHFWYQGVIIETILTWVLTQTVLMSAVDTTENSFAPLAIAFSVTSGILAGGSISGPSINLARTLGPSVSSLIFPTDECIWPSQYIYYIGALLGSCITVSFYR